MKKGKKKNKNKKKELIAARSLKKNTNSKADTNREYDSKFDEIFDYDVHEYTEKLQKTILKQVFNNICDTDDEKDL